MYFGCENLGKSRFKVIENMFFKDFISLNLIPFKIIDKFVNC